MEILRGYTTQKTAYEVKDYPYGFRLRTSIFYWIESKEGKGDRLCTYTIDPRNGRHNKPKYGTYVPFLFMYINPENGHVEHECIDSYNPEEFKMKFFRITEFFGIEFLSDAQKANIRKHHLSHVYYSAPYQAVKYSAERKPEFWKWANATLNHIKTCEFAELTNYPEPPEQDNPTGEVKVTVTEYRPAAMQE